VTAIGTQGSALLSAHEAILKGVLEAETPVALITGPRSGAFAMVFRLAATPAMAQALRENGTRIIAAPDATRAITLVGQAAQSGLTGDGARGALALIPNDRLDGATPELARLCSEPLTRGGPLCVLLEDDPHGHPSSCPRLASLRLGMPAIEVGDISQLRDAMSLGMLISRTARCVVGIIAHVSVLRSADTVEVRPNRVGRVVEVLHARRLRRIRLGLGAEAVDGSRRDSGAAAAVLRAARRLELNRFRAPPSPGERVAAGFITVGPVDGALMHLVDVLQLHGRVPILNLQLINPMDEAAVGRMLSRCERVLVLEPRPGTLETEVLTVAERMRQRGEEPSGVWGRLAPPDDAGESAPVTPDDVHPSMLARKITHLLHAVRPSAQVATQLSAAPPVIADIPARESAIGSGAALREVRRLLRDVDQWLRDRAPLQERTIEPTALAIDGSESTGGATRRVIVETWDHRRFLRCGPPAIVQAARDDRPWLIIACESDGEDVGDLERIARGVIPADRVNRVTLQTANLTDLVDLRDRLREAALRDGLTVLIVRDGPPPRYDTSALDAALAETDRLGFEPRQRMAETVDEICALRQVFVEDEHRQQAIAGTSLRTETSIERVSDRVTTKFRLRVRPMFEEVEVTRVRPPDLGWRRRDAMKLPTPQPVHGSRPRWRVHLAGTRGDAPGAAAIALSEAARLMGYHVRMVHDPTPIGSGRRAWTQMLFTRPRRDEAPGVASTLTPFGETDLLLGLDAKECLRAISADGGLRVATEGDTCAVVNTAPFIDDHDFEAPSPAPSAVAGAISAVTSQDRRVLGDFAVACRSWFHTDRVTDMAMLGVAYQRGFIPISAESIEGGLAAAESRGFGRAREAFDLGRRLALDNALFTQRDDDAEIPLERVARRLALSMRRGLPGSASRANRLAAMLQTSIEQMPGLAETDSGRQSRRDFVMACHHCTIWGGLDYAETYADLITRLYQVDRGDTGRALTRAAILPLAEAMLIRDPLYVAGVVASAEHRRRIRNRLHAKRARGDEIERRYLTRFDLLAFGRRVRLDLRTSDWPARLAAIAYRLTPRRFRGGQRERLLRDHLLELARRAIVESPADYQKWSDAMQRLHDQAVADRLRGMALAEVRMLTGVGEPTAPALPAS